MIIAQDFQLNYGEIVNKAITGEHAAPAAPSAPAASSHTPAAPAPAGGGQTGGGPSGGGSPRPGHRYVKRWWDGSKWQYEYPGEAGASQHRGQMQYGDPKKREHTLELKEGHSYGAGQEQQAYHETFGQAMAPGSVHTVQHPGKPDQQLQVKRINAGRLQVSDASGKAQIFKTPSAYERWYRTIQMGPVEIPSPDGKPFVHIVPNVGDPDESGQLTPSSDPRQWFVKLAKDADPGLAAHFKAPRLGYVGKDEATAAAANMLRYVESQSGQKFQWQPAGGAPAAQPAVASVAAQGAMAQPTTPQQPVNMQQLQQQGWQGFLAGESDPAKFDSALNSFGWQDQPDPESRQMVRRINASPEQKEQLVQHAAMQFTPLVRKLADQLAGGQGDMTKRKFWLEKLFGDVPPDPNVPFSPQPGTWIHDRLGRIIDAYDPSVGVGFTGYAQRSLTQDMKQWAEKLRDEQGRQAPSEITDESGRTQSVADLGLTAEGGTPEAAVDPVEAHDNWVKMQGQRIYQLAKEKNVPKDVVNYLLTVIPKVKTDEDIGKFVAGMRKYGWDDYVMNKALIKALTAMANELKKATASTANPFITRDKKIDPTHEYAFREGDDDHPRYYYKDRAGNFIRYTNAPNGHKDASNRMGEAHVHPGEPTFAQAPQFFDPNGRKLSRAPYPGAVVEWNPSYHPHDPNNLWVGRWVNPLTGEHEHTYVDADMRMIPKLHIHQTVALVDVRLPVLRKYVRELASSPMLKDQIVAVTLALVDQGRFRAQELTMLTPSDVFEQGALYKIGNRLIYPDARLRSLLALMTKGRTPTEPLFAVPFMKKDGKVDATLIRRIGPHFLQCSFDQIGISLSGLQVYHASQTFSREMSRLLRENNVPWESAVEYATVAVALEMGHDLTKEPDMAAALPMIRELLIDPVVLEVLQRNAKEMGLLGNAPVMLPLPPPPIAVVSLDLVQRTGDEQEFSKWLHGYAAHSHVTFEEQQQAAPKANGPDLTPPQPEADPTAQAQMGTAP